ncbi:MAG: 3-oxoacyl-[acyl-carrier-protein] synthase-1 [Parvicellaceae bacterium]|jgi:3-oxoacyl-[acyl-carrier-protein] synthase-1
MKVFAGAEHIISPLGTDAETCYENIISGKTGVAKRLVGTQKFSLAQINRQELEFKGVKSFWRFLLSKSVEASLSKLNDIKHDLVYVVSSAKGEIHHLHRGIFGFGISHSAKAAIGKEERIYCVSNACVSGLLALNMGYDLIQSGKADTVVVSGIDLISDFVVSGFNSLFALDPEQCKPFDKNRKGLNLGEAVGTIVLSKDSTIFKEEPIEFLGGFSNNDANHISGPSRTGEGLKKAVTRTLKHADVVPDFINAHGTGTDYNDGMEAEAFSALGLAEVPLNSLKSVFGHTLGAAGIIETIISIQGLRNGTMPGTFGLKSLGTNKTVNAISGHHEGEVNSFLKTCSGFGGGNAAVIFRKI